MQALEGESNSEVVSSQSGPSPALDLRTTSLLGPTCHAPEGQPHRKIQVLWAGKPIQLGDQTYRYKII